MNRRRPVALSIETADLLQILCAHALIETGRKESLHSIVDLLVTQVARGRQGSEFDAIGWVKRLKGEKK